VVHKLEYFLNARIVGGEIKASAWELLCAMLLFEAAFGLPGLVAAPIFYAYAKAELRQLGLRAEKILKVFGEQTSFRQMQFYRLPHRGFGNIGRRLQKDVRDSRAEADGQRQNGHPPIFQQENQETLNSERGSRRR